MALVRKYFERTEVDYMLYNYECRLCRWQFEPDTLTLELVNHLQQKHPNLQEWK